MPVLLPSQLCAAHSDGLCLLEATRSALEADHDCVLAMQDRFSHPSKVVPAWSACVCPVVLEGDQFSELELGGTCTKGLCAGGNSAGHETWVWKVLAGSLRIVQKEEKSHCLWKKKGIHLLSHLYFMIKINNFKLLVFDTPLKRSPNIFKDAEVIHKYIISMSHCSFFLTKKRN